MFHDRHIKIQVLQEIRKPIKLLDVIQVLFETLDAPRLRATIAVFKRID